MSDLSWTNLLATKRVRELRGGETTRREATDLRSEFRRDYGRAVFSTPFRRLQDKAQVFALEPMDGIRTRLTHSIEVGNVAMDLANGIGLALVQQSKLTEEQSQSIATIAATVGLLHDLGNPPFGHAGEDAIRSWFNAKNEEFWTRFGLQDKRLQFDFRCFEGNAQTIRLASRLQVLADDNGLNLTLATMSALQKYLGSADRLEEKIHEYKKPGCFLSEAPLVNLMRKELGLEGARNPISLIAEAADDIVYAAVDIEDGIKKGLLGWNDVKAALEAASKDPAITARQSDLISEVIAKTEGYIGSRIKFLPSHLVDVDEAYSQYFRTMAIQVGVAESQRIFITKYSEIMAGNCVGEILYSSDAGPLFTVLKKKIGKPLIYRSKEAVKLEVLGINVVHGLMDIFSQAFDGSPGQGLVATSGYADKVYALFSRNYKLVYELEAKKGDLPVGYYKLRLLTDYICGMTDSFALDLYRELTYSRL